jgi:hypothetical protein
MAITFEEKNNTGKMVASILMAVLLLGAAGFFAWKYLVAEAPVATVALPQNEKIDDKLLNDFRVDDLKLFPEIPPSAVPAGKANPFSEAVATTTTANDGAKVVAPAE